MSNRPRPQRREVSDPVDELAIADQRRNQSFDRLADQRIRGPAKHRFERAIRHHNRTGGVDRDDALGCRFQQEPQLAIVFLVATGLPRLLHAPARRDVEFKTRQPSHLAGGVAIGTSQALHPQHGSIRLQEPVGVVPRILAAGNFFERRMHLGSIVDVDVSEPGLERRRLVGGKTESGSEGVVPVGAVGARIPRPRTAARGADREAKPMLALAQRRLGPRAFDGVPGSRQRHEPVRSRSASKRGR